MPARVIGASAGRALSSSPVAASSWSRTAGSSRCSTPAGTDTARVRRRCISEDMTAEQWAPRRLSAGPRIKESP